MFKGEGGLIEQGKEALYHTGPFKEVTNSYCRELKESSAQRTIEE